MRQIADWEDIRPGDYWSAHGDAWISRAIQWVTQSYWNHSGQVIDGGMVQEALTTVEENPLGNYKEAFNKGNLIVFRSQSPRTATLVALAKSRAKTGQPYAWAGTASLLVFVPLNRFLALFGLQLPTPFRKWEKCSELVLTRLRSQVLIAEAMDRRIPDLDWVMEVPDQDGFTPGDLVIYSLEACKTHPS